MKKAIDWSKPIDRLEILARLIRLRKQVGKHIPVDICKSEIPALMTISQSLMIHP